jgi:hypothetical protein
MPESHTAPHGGAVAAAVSGAEWFLVPKAEWLSEGAVDARGRVWVGRSP